MFLKVNETLAAMELGWKKSTSVATDDGRRCIALKVGTHL